MIKDSVKFLKVNIFGKRSVNFFDMELLKVERFGKGNVRGAGKKMMKRDDLTRLHTSDKQITLRVYSMYSL